MSEPTLYLDATDNFDDKEMVAYLVKYEALVLVEPDYEAMATVMNVTGWTCDGHEPGAWCEDCKRLQLSTAKEMWRAGIGGDDE